MSTFIHGVASAQCLDKSGEIVDIKGLDISSLPITGVCNYEHKSDLPSQICGKILTAKKIFNQSDCSNDNELSFWNKTKVPFVYITAELLDDYCQSGKDAAGLFRYAKDNPDKQSILGFSVEGSEIPNTRKGTTITRSIARKVTLTAAPCNAACIASILEHQKSKIRDEFEEIFKSEANAIEMFKTEQGSKMYEEYLAKSIDQSSKFGIKNDKIIGHTKSNKPIYHNKIIGHYNFNPQEHREASTLHQRFSEVAAKKKNQDLVTHHAQKSKMHLQAAERVKRLHEDRLQNSLKAKRNKIENKITMSEKDGELKKALEAGSTNAAPSTLVNGAAYQTESFSKPKKKDWNKRAKDDYQNWPEREKFEKFMASRMPHLKRGEIAAIGRALCLKKNIELEKSLEALIKNEQKYHIHVDGKPITLKPLTLKEIKEHTGKFPHELEKNPNTKVVPHKG